MLWEEHPLTLGEAHEGFFYPDPLGFWAEIRKWTVELLKPHAPDWGVSEALSVTTRPKRHAFFFNACTARSCCAAAYSAADTLAGNTPDLSV